MDLERSEVAVAPFDGGRADELARLHVIERKHAKRADPRVRAASVEALMSVSDSTILARLIPLLDDPHHRVRAVAALAFGPSLRPLVWASAAPVLRVAAFAGPDRPRPSGARSLLATTARVRVPPPSIPMKNGPTESA